MRGRMAAVGGTATVVSVPGHGTTVTLSWRERHTCGRVWPGAAGAMPRRARNGILLAAAGWHLSSALSVLFVSWRLGWVRYPGLTLAGVLLTPALLVGGVVVAGNDGTPGTDRRDPPSPAGVGLLLGLGHRLFDRIRPAVVWILLLLGPVLTSLNGVLVEPRHVVRDYADPLTVTGATLTAAVTFLAGRSAGMVALVLNCVAIVVVGPLVNGHDLIEIINVTTVERLGITFLGWYLFVRVGPLLVVSVTARRRAAAMRARIMESTAISERLAPVLMSIASAAAPTEAVRRQAFAALAWARQRLTGTSRPGDERLGEALAGVAARHRVVQRPPHVVHVDGVPDTDAVVRLAEGLEIVLGALDRAGDGPVTVTAAGSVDELRVTVSRADGPPLSASTVDQLERLVAATGCGVAVETRQTGGTVVVLTTSGGATATDSTTGDRTAVGVAGVQP